MMNGSVLPSNMMFFCTVEISNQVSNIGIYPIPSFGCTWYQVVNDRHDGMYKDGVQVHGTLRDTVGDYGLGTVRENWINAMHPRNVHDSDPE